MIKVYQLPALYGLAVDTLLSFGYIIISTMKHNKNRGLT